MSIGGFDLLTTGDRAFAFDFDSSGKMDHLLFYRPGAGIIVIVKKNPDGTFAPLLPPSGSNGIGGFDLRSPADLAFAFDFDSSGKMDHLVFYRPGTGIIFIVRKNPDGTFAPLPPSGPNGIGGFDLRSPADRAFAFDFDSSGKTDHLLFYRPGTGIIFIVKKNPDGTFTPLPPSGPNGIGGFDLRSPADRAFAFDFDSSGKMDHLVFYRPGTGIIFIVKKNPDGTFAPLPPSGPNGIGGFDLRSPADRVFAFDFDSSGKMDHLVFYRPGTGIIFIVKKNPDGTFAPLPPSGPNGIGGFDLRSPADRAFAFDFDSSGKMDHLVFYRPGTGIIFILRNNHGSFVPISVASTLPPFSPASYTFTLDSIDIFNTRSLGKDTNHASVSAAVGNNPPTTVLKDLGDQNNGHHPIGLKIGPVLVNDPNTGVVFNYLIVNSGHQNSAEVAKALTTVGNALASKGAEVATSAIGAAVGLNIGSVVLPVIGSALGALAGFLVGGLAGILGPNCDGPVASEQLAFKGIDLFNRTVIVRSFQHSTLHPGIDSPAGCGSNSRYTANFTISRV